MQVLVAIAMNLPDEMTDEEIIEYAEDRLGMEVHSIKCQRRYLRSAKPA